MKYPLLDEIGNHFMDKSVELVKAGHKFVFVLDNIDWTTKVHEMRSDNQNKSVHAVATSLVFDRIASYHLPNYGPPQNLENIAMRELVSQTNDEIACTRKRYKVVLGWLLLEFFSAFQSYKELLPARSMANQSVVIPFPVQMKDEKKYSDMIDVLDTLEKWVSDIHCKAGLCIPQDPALHGPMIEDNTIPGHSSGNQTPAHDSISSTKVPCYGDQLTRVRMTGAKDLRAGSHTAADKFEHLHPFRIVDWHTKRSFLKVYCFYCHIYT